MALNRQQRRALEKMNKKTKTVCRILITMDSTGKCETIAHSPDPRLTMGAFECALRSAMDKGAFNKVMSPYKQMKRFKRSMLYGKSWVWRHIISLFI